MSVLLVLCTVMISWYGRILLYNIILYNLWLIYNWQTKRTLWNSSGLSLSTQFSQCNRNTVDCNFPEKLISKSSFFVGLGLTLGLAVVGGINSSSNANIFPQFCGLALCIVVWTLNFKLFNFSPKSILETRFDWLRRNGGNFSSLVSVGPIFSVGFFSSESTFGPAVFWPVSKFSFSSSFVMLSKFVHFDVSAFVGIFGFLEHNNPGDLWGRRSTPPLYPTSWTRSPTPNHIRSDSPIPKLLFRDVSWIKCHLFSPRVGAVVE